MNIVCVLKTGGDFTSDYVVKLRSACGRHIKEKFRFICLTDDITAKNLPRVISTCLKHGYSGWWSKFEIFRLKGPTLYFDLDTVIIKNIDDMVYQVKELSPNEILGMSKFNPLRWSKEGRFTSGIIGWNGDFRFMFSEFDYIYALNCRYHGDADAMLELLNKHNAIIKYDMRGIYSYKRHCKIEIPEDAKVICFHGSPRPHQATSIPLVRENWI